MELTTVVPKPPEKRTITVIQSPARPAADDDSAGVTGLAGVTGPAEDEDSVGVTGPAGVTSPADEDSAGVAQPTEDDDSAGDADPAEREDSPAAHSAGGASPAGQGTPAGTTPARSQTPDQQGQDSVMLSEDGSMFFPSVPRRINQTSLLAFMSMMTLMQRRMDTVMPVPDNQDRPTVETPRTRESQTMARRSRTPVRRCRSSTRSRSPVRRSSSSESPPRDGSPVNFSAALDTAENIRDRSLSDYHDEEGSSRKVSSAQYQLFR